MRKTFILFEFSYIFQFTLHYVHCEMLKLICISKLDKRFAKSL